MCAGSLPAELRVQALSVGYGESYFLQDIHLGKSRWNALIDTGPQEASPIILMALEQAGISRLDDVFLTHDHPNHMGGLPAILQRYQVRRTHHTTDVQSQLERGPLKIDILNLAQPGLSVHDSAMVLLISDAGKGFLFASDLSIGRQEKVGPALAKTLQARAAMLVLATWPHHGDELSPLWAAEMEKVPHLFVSVGANPYKLPREDLHPLLWKRAQRTDRGTPVMFPPR